MFKEMRRKDKQLPQAEVEELLQTCEYCTLATIGEDGWPCTTPLSYVMLDEKLYFHCSTKGQKLDNIRHDERVCVSIVTDTEPVWDNDFTTYYRSVTAFGKARILEAGERKYQALIELVRKYLPAHLDQAERIIEQTKTVTDVVEITLEHVTGKAKKKKA